MYLSKIEWELAGKPAYRLVSDCYELHRTIMSGFPDNEGNPREKYNVLYNLKINEKNAVLLVQSAVEADWEKSFSELDKNSMRINKRSIPRAFYTFKEKEIIRFKLVANPSKKIVNTEKKNSSRVFISGHTEQVKWLMKKGEQYGFVPYMDQLDIRQMGNVFGRKKGIVFKKVEYGGALQVCQPDLFGQAFCKGIGSEKAFGCGMLLFMRAGDK